VGGEAIGSEDDHRRSQAGPEGIGEEAAEGHQKKPEPQGRVAAQHGRQTSRAVVLQLSPSQPASDGRVPARPATEGVGRREKQYRLASPVLEKSVLVCMLG